LVDSSPRPIAASHVLHRLLVPRHPPSALDNLTTKMLASTVQFSNNKQTRNPTTTHQTNPTSQTPEGPDPCGCGMDGQARPARKNPPHPGPPPSTPHRGLQARKPLRCLFFQDPTGCLIEKPTSRTHHPAPHPGSLRDRTRGDNRPLPVKKSVCQRLRLRAAPPPHSDGTGSLDPITEPERSLERR